MYNRGLPIVYDTSVSNVYRSVNNLSYNRSNGKKKSNNSVQSPIVLFFYRKRWITDLGTRLYRVFLFNLPITRNMQII